MESFFFLYPGNFASRQCPIKFVASSDHVFTIQNLNKIDGIVNKLPSRFLYEISETFQKQNSFPPCEVISLPFILEFCSESPIHIMFSVKIKTFFRFGIQSFIYFSKIILRKYCFSRTLLWALCLFKFILLYI